MDYSCQFAPDARFGSYPFDESLNELYQNGIRLFADVTCGEQEGTPPYDDRLDRLCKGGNGGARRISFPIPDLQAPVEHERYLFEKFVDHICDALSSHPPCPVYIHCRGGHGRSALVAACVLIRLYGLTSDVAGKTIFNAHQTRRNISLQMRTIGAPQTHTQFHFMHNFEIQTQKNNQKQKKSPEHVL